jgi:hypothetical protein
VATKPRLASAAEPEEAAFSRADRLVNTVATAETKRWEQTREQRLESGGCVVTT